MNDPVDGAIDRGVRRIVGADPAAGFESRVRARLSSPAPVAGVAGAWQRAAASALALLLVLAAGIALRPYWPHPNTATPARVRPEAPASAPRASGRAASAGRPARRTDSRRPDRVPERAGPLARGPRLADVLDLPRPADAADAGNLASATGAVSEGMAARPLELSGGRARMLAEPALESAGGPVRSLMVPEKPAGPIVISTLAIAPLQIEPLRVPPMADPGALEDKR